jgi:hypothetical protein
LKNAIAADGIGQTQNGILIKNAARLASVGDNIIDVDVMDGGGGRGDRGIGFHFLGVAKGQLSTNFGDDSH